MPELLGTSVDNLKDWGEIGVSLQRNIFFRVFKNFSQCMATRDAHVRGTTGFDRDPTPESDLSTSSAEDKPEEPSRLILSPLVDPILLHSDFPCVSSGGYQYSIASYVQDGSPRLQAID